jgi:hypothetical protein
MVATNGTFLLQQRAIKAPWPLVYCSLKIIVSFTWSVLIKRRLFATDGVSLVIWAVMSEI